MQRNNQLLWSLSAILLTALSGAAARSDALITAQAKYAPMQRWWETYPVRTVDALAPLPVEPKVDLYGGRVDKVGTVTGYFHTQKIGDRWWLIDPDGHLFLNAGVDSVTSGNPKPPTNWASAATDLLRDYGFNGVGAWSSTPALRKAARPLVYTLLGQPGNKPSGGFMSAFDKKHHVGHQAAGHWGYPHGCIPVFNPEFGPFCDKFAKPLASLKQDRHLLGYFSDNELPLPRLDSYLALKPNDREMGTSCKAAKAWLKARKGPDATARDITWADRHAWTEYVLDKYFAITTGAIRKADPNHLCLGSRFVGASVGSQAAFQAAGKYLDVIAINDYGVWDPALTRVAQWTKWSGKSVLISEFYAKGMDSGLPNKSGAGWVVATQRDRGLFYQTFTLGLLEAKNCVGWHWFKYRDNDPAGRRTDPSNRDSNKGIVRKDNTPYTALLYQMRDVNNNIYAIADKFDSIPATDDLSLDQAGDSGERKQISSDFGAYPGAAPSNFPDAPRLKTTKPVAPSRR